ncbi:MAG: 4Fe-4S binding protein [Candidatus Sumerlaeota bacterium]|nr:4Fe-4S binding protein [Candidatus Sumerlaeota bacterium]
MERFRKTIQTLSLLALHSSWGPEAKWLCNPVLSCHSCALAWFACPVGVFVHYSGYHVFPFFALGFVLLIGALVGRLLCGWVCPFGFVQDLLHKIAGPKFSLPQWVSYGKYASLVLLVVLFPYLWGEETQWSFCRFCPAAALQVTTPAIVAGTTKLLSPSAIIKFSVLAVVVLFAIFSYRSFCQSLCPIGALLAPLNYVSFWSVKIPRESCLSCAKCDKACGLELKPSERIIRGVPANRSADCIVCYDCQTACKTLNAKKRET